MRCCHVVLVCVCEPTFLHGHVRVHMLRDIAGAAATLRFLVQKSQKYHQRNDMLDLFTKKTSNCSEIVDMTLRECSNFKFLGCFAGHLKLLTCQAKQMMHMSAIDLGGVT